MNTSTLCCHWCKIPLGNASQVTYLNGNLPICDLCLSKDKRITELEKLLDKIYWHADAQGTAQAQILQAFAEKDKRIAELEENNAHLRCCGNCHYYKTCFRSCNYCDNWQSDNLTREERK